MNHPRDLWVAITGDEADATLQMIQNDAKQHDRSGVRVLMPCKGRGPLAAQPPPAENICCQMLLFGQVHLLTTCVTKPQPQIIIFSSWPQGDGEALQQCLHAIGIVPDFFLSSAPAVRRGETNCIFFSPEDSVLEIMDKVKEKLCAQTHTPPRIAAE